MCIHSGVLLGEAAVSQNIFSLWTTGAQESKPSPTVHFEPESTHSLKSHGLKQVVWRSPKSRNGEICSTQCGAVTRVQKRNTPRD